MAPFDPGGRCEVWAEGRNARREGGRPGERNGCCGRLLDAKKRIPAKTRYSSILTSKKKNAGVFILK